MKEGKRATQNENTMIETANKPVGDSQFEYCLVLQSLLTTVKTSPTSLDGHLAHAEELHEYIRPSSST